jgi:hypothetical protein
MVSLSKLSHGNDVMLVVSRGPASSRDRWDSPRWMRLADRVDNLGNGGGITKMETPGGSFGQEPRLIVGL